MTATLIQNTEQLQATTTSTKTTTVNVSSSRRTRRVTFSQDQEVHHFESPNRAARKELFYQSQDYVQFRAEFQLHKAQQAQKVTLQQQQQYKQMVYKQPLPIVTRRVTVPQYRLALPRGWAQMA